MMTLPRLLRIASPSLFVAIWFASAVMGQTETATVSGLVTDRTAAAVSGAQVRLQSVERGTVTTTTTNNAGIYVFPSVQPGQYQISIQKQGFKQVDLLGLIVNVQDHIEQNFRLEVGSVAESVTVEAGASMINTMDASVSTVVDQTYVANMPLNGRSFQDLILLTPGVVTNSPQTSPFSSASVGVSGEFSVNGQRTESNYYTVDGVSANVGALASAPNFPATSGSLPVSTTLGTTQGLVSIDSLQEFRVQSSTYSAEYGRSPGGQFNFVTRSGANQWHGTAFDYLRNDVFDANDWFNGYFNQPKPPLRQNDFGGTLGGPVVLPKLYNGRDKTFFFFSYEGLRLLEPQAASVSYVPDTALRQSTATALQPVVNAFPKPNGSELLDSSGNATGLAQFIAAWSNPSQIDAVSVRFDEALNDRLHFFFRFSDTSSSSSSRFGGLFAVPSDLNVDSFETRTYTVGVAGSFSTRMSNDLRINYSSNEEASDSRPDNFGGAQSINLFQLQGIGPSKRGPDVTVFLGLGSAFLSLAQSQSVGKQRQWNIVDVLSRSFGSHLLKMGADYRRLTPVQQFNNLFVSYEFDSPSSVQANNVDSLIVSRAVPAYPLYRNFSAFVQDEWRISSRLNLSMGLRWEVNPAPGATQGQIPYTVEGSSLSTLTLAPLGTPLWQTTWFNFAPRLGAAYVLRKTPNWELVLRGGGGAFFDTGQQVGSFGYNGPGTSAMETLPTSSSGPVSFPLAADQVNSFAIPNPPSPPYGIVFAYPTHLQLPYALQWNVSAQQALGKSQALTVSYVGSVGRRLLEQSRTLIAAATNPNIRSLYLFRNGLTSDYGALQTQYQRRLLGGLQALAAYTWSHCIDYGSQNLGFPYVRGNCDFDVRHNFSSALSYDLPNHLQNRFARLVLHHWGIDDRFTARTAFPVTLNGRGFLDSNRQIEFAGLNLVPNQPIYLYGSQFPGGRSINPAAFALSLGKRGNAPRNFVRGFGAWQMDMAVRREFPIHENLKLQFRAEAFNIFNHPNFGLIDAQFASPTFGQATRTLASSLGVLSPLYQMGGPRSMQFALKVVF